MSGSRKTLEELRNCYAGRRAFILGNGPSLKKLDLRKLSTEITFGVNGLFYLFDEMGFKPTFYCVEDKLFAEDRIEEVNAIRGTTKIFGDYLKYCFADSDETIWANVKFDYSNYSGFPHFSRNAAEHLWVGGTVSYLCMQLAYHMGFSEVYLIGFDHSYQVPTSALLDGTEITSTEDDPNHFHPDYFGKGKRWHQPRLDRMELCYQRALRAFQADDRLICNAGTGGKLESFPRVDFEGLFESKSVVRSVSAPPVLSLPSRPDPVRISAVVCTYRNPQLLEKTLRSLTSQDLPAQDHEILVVDNNSNDETPEIVARFPSVRYVFEAEQGLSAARNAGIKAAAGEIIAFIDDDAEAEPGWLRALVETYERHPEALAVGGKALPVWGAPKPHWLTPKHHRSLSLIDWGEQERALSWPERIIGVNCSFRREVFDRFDRFDTKLGRLGVFLLGSEDVALQKKIYESGGQIYYSPDATVHHFVPPARLTRRYFYVRRLASKLDDALMELRAQGLEGRIPQILEPMRTQSGVRLPSAQSDALVESLRRALTAVQETPGWSNFESEVLGSPQYRQRLQSEASEAVAHGEWLDAEKALRSIAHSMLVHAEAYLPTIELLILTGHISEAADEIEHARMLDRRSPGLLCLQGIVQHHQGDLEGARESFRRDLEQRPSQLDTWLALAKVELDMGLEQQAGRSYQHAASLDPNHPGLQDWKSGVKPAFGPELLAPLCEVVESQEPVRPQASSEDRLKPIANLGPAEDGIRISAIICTYRNPEQLEGAIRSLESQSLDPALYEIIVVDNNSEDATAELAARHTRVRYVLEPNQGLAIARNAGVRFARGEVIAFMDDDAEADPDWLKALLKVYDQFPEALAVGGRAIPIWDESPPPWLDHNYHRALSLIDWGSESRLLHWPERIIGVNCSFRRETFREIGAFDAALGRTGKFLLGSEDTEIQRRIHETRRAVYYTPHALVHHHVPPGRMTRTYFFERQLGNLLSLAIEALRAEGADERIDEIRTYLGQDEVPDLAIRGLNIDLAVLADAFRCAAMGLRVTSSWTHFEEQHLATAEEQQRILHATQARLAQNDWSGAENLLRELTHRVPTRAEAYLPLIDLLSIAERDDEAREVIELALAVNPRNSGLLRSLAENRRRAGDLDAAEVAIEHALAGSPKEPSSLIVRGRLSLERGYRAEALSHYRRASEYASGDVASWIDILRGARELGDHELAELALQRGRDLDPQRPEWNELSRMPSPEERRIQESQSRIRSLRDRHAGKRCVIIGNGPSLNQMDLEFLSNEITFGLNRIYLLSERMNFQPTYYVCMNPLVLEQSAREIQALSGTRFLRAQEMDRFAEDERTLFLQPMPGPGFAVDPSCGLWEGHTVTYVAMQLAYHMGFTEVVLIGVDHEYIHPAGAPNQEVVASGPDINHFDPNYFGAGVRWHLPDLANSEVAYRLAKENFEAAGRSIVDATVDGKLTVFPKADYREIFALPAKPETPTRVEVANTDYKVTAIVSTYNAEHLIRNCLADLEAQTISDRTEIIVVDSGSSQNEAAIVREFQNSHPNIVYVRTQRETLYEAWNRGVRLASGEYVTNANTDDRHRPDAFERMAAELDRGSVGLVYADSLITTLENESFDNHSATRVWKLPSFSARQVLMDCPFGPQPMWRRALHDDCGDFEGRYRLAGDYEFFMRLALKHGARHIDEILGLYYESPNNLSYNQSAMEAELAQFLSDYRNMTPLEQLYPFLEQDTSDEARVAACFDFANHLVWMTPYPALDYAEEIYRKLIVRAGACVEFTHNLALVLLLKGRNEEGGQLLQNLRSNCREAQYNLELLEAGRDVNPRELRFMGLHHPGLESMPATIPAWHTRLPHSP